MLGTARLEDSARHVDTKSDAHDRLQREQLMRERLIRSAAAGRPIVGLALCGALLVPLPASALDSPVLGGSGAGIGDYLEYNSRADTLAPCNAPSVLTPYCTFLNNGTYPPDATLAALLQGDLPPPSGNAGGNVELFASSETLTVAQYAAYTGVTSLSGTLDGVPVTLSSLTWADWEVGSYDCSVPTATALPGGLLDRWLTDLETAYSLSLTPTERANAITRMVCGNFLRSFSDPNIAYVYDFNPGDSLADPVIGLAGTYDLCTTLNNIFPGVLPPNYCLLPVVTRPPIQVSEIVKVQAGGLSTILYNFKAVTSGQSELTDPQSHTGVYEVIAPFDPPNGEKVGVATGENAGRPIIEWTMTWVNGADQDRYVRIFDRLTDGEYYDAGGTVSCTLRTEAGAPLSAVPVPLNLRYGDPGSSAQKDGSCRYDAALDGILFEGVIPGTADPNYRNTVEITFQYIPDDPQVEFPIENTVCTTWDSTGDGDLDTVPACLQGFADEPVPPGPPMAIPVMQPFGLALMSVGLLIAAAWSRRRR